MRLIYPVNSVSLALLAGCLWGCAPRAAEGAPEAPPQPPAAPSLARQYENLFPIGALEGHLRRALGDPKLLRRWIESLVTKEVARA